MVVLGGTAVSYERDTPAFQAPRLHLSRCGKAGVNTCSNATQTSQRAETRQVFCVSFLVYSTNKVCVFREFLNIFKKQGVRFREFLNVFKKQGERFQNPGFL